MSWPILVCLVLCVGFGVAIPYARRLDRMDEYHIFHGPDSGCPDCQDK